jgi:undecaprenyl-diphosphatase
MTLLQAFLLALTQGVTEFLPISSSAHLILVPFVLGWPEHDLRFDIVTNGGTLVAAVFFFRNDLREAWAGAWKGIPWLSTLGGKGAQGARHLGLAEAVVVASLPVLLVGFLFYDWFSTTARQPVIIALTSIGFGILLGLADRYGSQERTLKDLKWSSVLVIGLAQALALVPGTSRSGATITAGRMLGFERETAARFSFLLAIPVGAAAFLKDLLALNPFKLGDGLLPLLVGFVVSGLSAYLMIGWLLTWLRRQSMAIFVVYRVVLGLVVLAFVW